MYICMYIMYAYTPIYGVLWDSPRLLPDSRAGYSYLHLNAALSYG